MTIQAQILRLLMDLRDRRGLSIILITHDLGIVAQTCDRIAVLRDGRAAGGRPEAQPACRAAASLHRQPDRQPSVAAGRGGHAGGAEQRHGSRRGAAARNRRPACALRRRGGLFRAGKARSSAVDGVSLRVMPGETVGIVGESGSGKSTLARAVLGLTPITSGTSRFDGADLAAAAQRWPRCGARRRWSSRTPTTRSTRG